MKLLELCLSPDFGGLEIHFRDLVRWLATRQDVSLCIGVQAGSRLAAELRETGAPVIEFAGRAGAVPILKARRLAEFCDRHDVDVVHIHWKFDLPLAALARRFSRRVLRVVHTRHMDLPGPKHDPYHEFLYSAVDRYIVVTEHLKQQASQRLPLPAGRIEVIYHGGRPAPDLSADEVRELRSQLGLGDGFAAGIIGRISHFKGQHLFIKAMARLKSEGCRVHGVVVGTAEHKADQDELERLQVELDMHDTIRLIPFRSDPGRIMRCLDVVVLATVKETFGMVLIEGMLAKAAVVGSDSGGAREIIEHERSGLLFEPNNAESLALALRRLYEDSELRHRLADAGYRRAMARFNQDVQFAKVLESLNQVAGPAR